MQTKKEKINYIAATLNYEVNEPQLELIYTKLYNKKEAEKKFRFIDLFAGIGGIRFPFEKLGGECVFTSEWDVNCQKTYFANYGEIPNGDINSIEVNSIPNHDILLAGFPCQAFSVAGYRKGFDDTRGTLFFNIAEILKEHRPIGFLLENVKGLVGHNHGNTFARIKEVLEKELEYKIYTKVLNSMTHANIPQNRERIIIIGVRKDINSLGEEHNIHHEFPPEEIKLTKTIHDLIEKDKKDEKYYYNKNHKYYEELNKSLKSKDTIYQWRRHYVRENKNNVCPTLTANMGTGGHNVPIIRDSFGIRKLTPKECARFQGFPENFILPNNLADSKLYYQIGNSVTVPLIKRVADNFINYLIKLDAFSRESNNWKQRKVL
ncbi:MAG: DNA cytosine methyltransferase [Ignavibacteriae bacterium]|nr:DNA cytosine methyltransferase [Ignavibacteriota bacterium]